MLKVSKSQSVTIVQMGVAFALTVVIVYLYATAAEVPGELYSAWGLVIGFYFGNTGKVNGAFSAGFSEGEKASANKNTLPVNSSPGVASNFPRKEDSNG